MIDGADNAANEAGFGAAGEEVFTRMCRVVGVAEGVPWCGVGGVDRMLSGRKRGLLVARGRRGVAHCLALSIS